MGVPKRSTFRKKGDLGRGEIVGADQSVLLTSQAPRPAPRPPAGGRRAPPVQTLKRVICP